MVKLLRILSLKKISRYYEQTETISKYFLAFGQRFPNSTLFRLCDSSHILLTKNKAILKEAAKFYSELFSSKMTNESYNETILDMFLPNDYKVINEAQRDLLQADITLQVLHEALTNMHKGRSPGLDGMMVNFYLFGFDDIGPYLLNVLMESLRDGILNIDQR